MSSEDISWKEDVCRKYPQYRHRYAKMEHQLFGDRGICARVVEDPDNQISKKLLKRMGGDVVAYSLNKQRRWEWFVPEILLPEETFRDSTQVYFRDESVDTNIWSSHQRVNKIHYLDDQRDEIRSLSMRGAQNTRDARIQLTEVFEGAKKDNRGKTIEQTPCSPRISYVRRACLSLNQIPVKRITRHCKWMKYRWYTEKKEAAGALPYDSDDLQALDNLDELCYSIDEEEDIERRYTPKLLPLADFIKITPNKTKKRVKMESTCDEDSWEMLSVESKSEVFDSGFELIDDIEVEGNEKSDEAKNQTMKPKLCEISLESISKRRFRARPRLFNNHGNFNGLQVVACQAYTDFHEDNEVKLGTRVVECVKCSTRLVISPPSTHHPMIRCAECLLNFCSRCGWEPHWPLSCEENQRWRRVFDIHLAMEVHSNGIECHLKRITCHCGGVTEFGDQKTQSHCSICLKALNPPPRRLKRYRRYWYPQKPGHGKKIPTPEMDNEEHKFGVIDSIDKVSLIKKQFSEVAIFAYRWRMEEKKFIELQRSIKNVNYPKGREALKQLLLRALYLVEYGTAIAYDHRQSMSAEQRATWVKLQKLYDEMKALFNSKNTTDSKSFMNIERLVESLNFESFCNE